jgi:cytochrome c oxidase subunit 2
VGSERRRSAGARALIALAPLIGGLAVASCDRPQSALNPGGPAAERIAELWWVMFGIAVAVCVLVIVLTGVAVLRRREDAIDRSPAAERGRMRWIVIGGVVFPAVVLTGVFIYTLVVLGWLARHGRDADVVVEVTGWRWWWEVRYLGEPQEQFTTANEIHIPTGRPVRLRLESGDVIHSFWVPELQGKTDLIPGQTNTLTIQADREGVYRGQCAEFCGLQHAHMAFVVVAESPGKFAAWADAQRALAREASEPLERAGHAAFLRNGCVLCHTIRGTTARGTVGPDLTHVGSRRTLAAGTLANTRGNLAGWISDPQGVKPGNLMPHVPLSPEELLSITAYLESLR